MISYVGRLRGQRPGRPVRVADRRQHRGPAGRRLLPARAGVAQLARRHRRARRSRASRSTAPAPRRSPRSGIRARTTSTGRPGRAPAAWSPRTRARTRTSESDEVATDVGRAGLCRERRGSRRPHRRRRSGHDPADQVHALLRPARRRRPQAGVRPRHVQRGEEALDGVSAAAHHARALGPHRLDGVLEAAPPRPAAADLGARTRDRSAGRTRRAGGDRRTRASPSRPAGSPSHGSAASTR